MSNEHVATRVGVARRHRRRWVGVMSSLPALQGAGFQKVVTALWGGVEGAVALSGSSSPILNVVDWGRGIHG